MDPGQFHSLLVRQDNGCLWIPDRYVHSSGYQQICLNGLQTYAHRAAVLAAGREIPLGFEVDHLCHNADMNCMGGSKCLHRRCGDIDHLEVVTPEENARRKLLHKEAANGWSPKCLVESCEFDRDSLGLCALHYGRYKDTGTTDDPTPYHRPACLVDACERLKVARGLCDLHYRRLMDYGSTNPHERRRSGPCERPDCAKKVVAWGLCDTHYRQKKRAGRVFK